MATTSSTGTIVTFYSWKGGVGRTMALANTAIQLARSGSSVLMVDWDLEAPGLDRYFLSDEAKSSAKVQTTPADDPSGLLGMLHSANQRATGQLEHDEWKRRVIGLRVPQAEPTFSIPTPPTPNRLDLLPAGSAASEYGAMFSAFSWTNFFADGRGAEWLEAVREEWVKSYEFILIDSRTGLTDSGGVCTVQMPHLLVLVLTANDQSMEGGLRLVGAIQTERASYGYDRGPLPVVPLVSRWEGENEVDIGEEWMRRFDQRLTSLTDVWLPKDFSPRQFVEKTRVPHVSRFSFGEPLPVLTHSISDSSLPDLYFDRLAGLIRSRLTQAGSIVDPAYRASLSTAEIDEEADATLLALVLDQRKLHQEIARIANANGAESDELFKFLLRAARALERVAQYNEAELLLRRALAISEKVQGPDHPDVGASLNNLAGLYRAQGRYAEAEPLYQRSLAIGENALGPDHTSVGTSLNNLAALYRAQGRYAEAEPLSQRSLAIREKALGPDHPDVGTSLNNLAGLYESQGRYAEAEPLYQRSLAISEKALGPDHPSVGTSLNNLAGLYHAQGRYSEAEPLYQRSLAIREKALGPDHPSIGSSLNNLAGLYQLRGRYTDAEPLSQRSLAISEKALGPDHPDVGTSLNNLAGLYESQGRYTEAEPLYQRSLAIREKALGPDHPDVGASLSNLAGIYESQGRYTDAESLYQRSLAIREKALGPDHDDVANSLNNLGELYSALGRYAEASACMRRCVSILLTISQQIGRNHPYLELAMNNYARALGESGRTESEIKTEIGKLQRGEK